MFVKIKILFEIVYYYILSIKAVKNANFYDINETVEYMQSTKKSLIRMGDGEFALMAGRSIHYQVYSKELQEELLYIVQQYVNNPSDSPYLLAMPGVFLKCNGLKLIKNLNYIKAWSRGRYEFKKNYDFPVSYGDAFLFARGNELVYEKLWDDQNVESIIFVHNSKVYADKFRDIYQKDVTFIAVPKINAFEIREEILKKIISAIKKKNEKTMVLVSAGPCAKYLVRRLSEMGIYAIDTGHCWDSPLNVI